MIFLHTFYIQSFQRNSLVLADKFRREFVLEIVPLIANLLMELGELQPGFLSIVRTFNFSTYSFLQNFQPVKRVFQVFMVLNFFLL